MVYWKYFMNGQRKNRKWGKKEKKGDRNGGKKGAGTDCTTEWQQKSGHRKRLRGPLPKPDPDPNFPLCQHFPWKLCVGHRATHSLHSPESLWHHLLVLCRCTCRQSPSCTLMLDTRGPGRQASCIVCILYSEAAPALWKQRDFLAKKGGRDLNNGGLKIKPKCWPAYDDRTSSPRSWLLVRPWTGPFPYHTLSSAPSSTFFLLERSSARQLYG